IIKELHRLYGDFGSGYPHDPRTVRFLEDWFRRNPGEVPPFIRGSWSTVKRIRRRLLFQG
ncbi:ribonuclease HII, partial [Candidatus Bathyarchaeota archaeon]